LTLEGKLPATLRGEVKFTDARDWLMLAEMCIHHKKRFAAAARFYAAAFMANPKLEDVQTSHRYDAACAAALAAGGKGEDAADLTDVDRARLRKQAIGWLEAERSALTGSLRKDNEASIAGVLRHWETDPDLAPVREEAALARLPVEERKAWAQFWANVAAMRQRLGGKK